MVSLFPVFFPVLAGLAMLDLKISRFKDRDKFRFVGVFIFRTIP